MWIDHNNLIKLCTKMDLYRYETGGLLLGRDDSVSTFLFDEGIRSQNADEYSPDVKFLNEMLQKYRKEGFEIYGMIHSHRTREELSCADIHYARRLLKLNELNDILMPVYVLESQNVFWYQVSVNYTKYLFITKEGYLMEKKEKNINEMTEVIIPEGKCCAYTCGDCGWSDPGERDKNGKIWCSRNRTYYYPYESSDSCKGYFTRRS